MEDNYTNISGNELLELYSNNKLSDKMYSMGKYGNQFIEDMCNRCVVYFLWNDDSIIYIGQSKSLMRRISEHYDGKGRRSKKQFNGLSWFFVEYEDIDFIEYFFIDLFRPKLNSHHGDGVTMSKSFRSNYNNAVVCGDLFNKYKNIKARKNINTMLKGVEE